LEYSFPRMAVLISSIILRRETKSQVETYGQVYQFSSGYMETIKSDTIPTVVVIMFVSIVNLTILAKAYLLKWLSPTRGLPSCGNGDEISATFCIQSPGLYVIEH
jgi:hypothetical protein